MNVDPFYLNVRLLNKDQVVRDKVTERVGEGLFAKAAGALANKLVSEDKVLEKLADTLTEKILSAVEMMGIKCELFRRFQQGPVVCFRVEIQSVDKLQLVLAAKGPEFASAFSRLLSTLVDLGLADTALPKVDEAVAQKVREGMMRRFCELIPMRCEEQGLKVDVRACSVLDEAETLFDMLNAVPVSEL